MNNELRRLIKEAADDDLPEVFALVADECCRAARHQTAAKKLHDLDENAFEAIGAAIEIQRGNSQKRPTDIQSIVDGMDDAQIFELAAIVNKQAADAARQAGKQIYRHKGRDARLAGRSIEDCPYVGLAGSWWRDGFCEETSRQMNAQTG